MIETEFVKHNPEIARLTYGSFYSRYAGTMQGHGQYAQLFMGSVAGITGVKDADRMTLMPWQGILSVNGPQVIAPHPKWCPHCMAEMVYFGEPYRPLVWSLALYEECSRHRTLLESVCRGCGKWQPYLPRYPDLAHCAHCGHPLWKELAHLEEKPSDGRIVAVTRRRWLSQALEEMVERSPTVSPRVARSRILRFLDSSADTLTGGSRATLCSCIGLGSRALNGLFTKGENPSLPLLLQIARGLCVSPGSLIQEDSCQPQFISHRNMWLFGELHPRVKPSRPDGAKRIVLEARLNQIANDPDDSRSMSSIARELGVSRLCVKYWYPDLYFQVRTKSLAAGLSRALGRREAYKTAIKEVVSEIRTEGMYPGRRRVEQLLRSRQMSLMQPEVRAAYNSFIKLV
jgi:hypothetical protein